MAKRLFYRIKEVAHQLGEPVSTVRYWETVFPQVSPHISPKSGISRRYAPYSSSCERRG